MNQKLTELNEKFSNQDAHVLKQMKEERHNRRMTSIKSDLKILIDYHNTNQDQF